MKNVFAPVCVLVLGLTSSGVAQRQDPELLKTLKVEPLSVIQIGDEVKIVKKSELTTLKKEIETKYRDAVKEYTQARAKARKAKEEFTSPKPVKESLTVLAASVKTEEEAEKLRDKVLNDYLVIQLNDSLKVIRKLEFVSFKAKVDADYRLAVAKHSEAKKVARKNKQSFKEPAPAKPKIRVVASRLTSEDAANEKMEALGNKGRKSKAKKTTPKKDDDEKDDEVEDDEVEDDDEKDDEVEDEDPEAL